MSRIADVVRRIGQVSLLAPGWLLASGMLFASPAFPAVRVADPGATLTALARDVQPGDRVLAWIDPDGARHAVSDAFGLLALEYDAGGAGPVTLVLQRDAAEHSVSMPAPAWNWQLAIDTAEPESAPAAAAWSALRAGVAAAGAQQWDAAYAAFAAAATARASDADRIRVFALQQLESDPDRRRWQALAEALEADVVARKLSGVRAAHAALARARALLLLRDYDAAADALTIAIERAGGEQVEHHVIAMAREGRGMIAYRRGERDATQREYDAALFLLARIAPDSAAYGVMQGRLATLALSRGDFTLAESIFAQAQVQLERVAPSSMALGRLRYNASVGAFERRRLQEAERHAQAAVDIFTRVAPGTQEQSMARAQVAEVMSKRGDDVRAEPLLRAALQQAAALDPASYETLSMRVQLAHALRWMQRRDEARAQMQQILALEEPGRPETIFLDARMLLGLIALDEGDAVAAEQEFAKIAPGYRSRSRPMPLANALHGLAQARRMQGRLDEVAVALDEALAIRARMAPDTSLEGEVHFERARLARAQGDRSAARIAYLRAIECLERHRDYIGGGEESRARWAARYADFYREPALWLLGEGDAAAGWKLLERYRAREFLAALGERRVELLASLPSELRAQNDALTDEYLRLQRQAASGDSAPLLPTERLLALTQRIAQVEPRLAGLSRVVAPAEVAAALPTDAVLLSYLVGPEQGWVLALAPGTTAPVAIPLPLRAAELARDVDAFNLLLSLPDAEGVSRDALLQRARSLHAQLIAPARSAIGRSAALLVIGDGSLHRLPFAALVDAVDADGRPHYLAQSLAVTQLASASAWLQHTAQPVLPSSLEVAVLAASTAVSAGGRDPLREAQSDTPVLPGARAEAESIAALFAGRASLHVDAAATLAAARDALGDAARTHFAGHAMLDGSDPLASYLQLAPRDGDDGRLRAIDLMRGALLHSRLVTLSACESALGADLGGEGLVGLTRAFQYAGVPSVVGTLWRVADRPTQSVMQSFYRELASGQAPDRALNRAQRAMIEQTPSWWERWWDRPPDHSHPFYWAAFVLVGAPGTASG